MQKSVIEYLADTVKRFPNKIAVSEVDGQMTFSELWNSARKLAKEVGMDNGTNCPVGVFLPKGGKMVAAFAGINMSGNFYVPLDVKTPEARIVSILNVLEAKILVTDKLHYDQLSAFSGDRKIVVYEDAVAEDIITHFDLSKQIDTDPVYAIFTSGSTGTPKGVVISHRGVIDYIDWAVSRFHIDENAIIGNQAPFYFDNSTLDIYLMYATGATLNLIPETFFAFPAKLIDYLNENKISFVFWVPFVLSNVANMNILEHSKPHYLKNVFFAGEVMPNKHLNYWRKHLPECRYVNLYGPTEITVDCTYYQVDRTYKDDEPLPIGFPCRNSDVLVLVDRKREAEVGEEGELCVRGSSLALGYYNDWKKTQASFIQNPLNKHYPELIYCTGDVVFKNQHGELMYVGRIDSQIKHNGYRIELGEIETAVLGCQLVENCCAAYDYEHKKIVLFYQSEKISDVKELRTVLVSKLPRYMIPAEYRKETVLKQNTSGKIDRKYYKDLANGKN